MQLFLKCFGCKRKTKKTTNKTVNSSGVKFAGLVTEKGIIQKQNNFQQNNKDEQTNQTQDKKTENDNSSEIKKDILITDEHEEEKNKTVKESLIADNTEQKYNNITFSKYGLNLNKEIGFDDPLLKDDSPLINNFEKGQKFTRKSLIETFNKFWALDKYKKIWDKENLLIEIRAEGTELNNECNLIKISYRQSKKEFNGNDDLQVIVDFFYEPTLRIKWDSVLKKIDILDGDKKTNYVISTWAKSPVFFMSERESLEKRFIFKIPEENAFYILSSSTPEELFPPIKDVVRITNYCNYYKIVDEGEYIGFYSLNQTDFKMPIPQFLMNVTLPTTTKNWQTDMEKFAKQIKYDKTTGQITYLNEKNEG